MCDLCDHARVREVLLRAAPEAVINAAGYTQVDLAEKEERQCMQANAEAVENLACCSAELECTLMQVSTDYVFSASTMCDRPFQESDTPSPQGVYARSKLAGEQAAACWSKHSIVRTCGLYGPLVKPSQRNFVETILRLAGRHDRLRVVNDQRCSPSYVRDIACGMLFLVQRRLFGIYHVVNHGSVTWYEFAREILKLSKITTPLDPITSNEYAAPAARPSYSVLSTAKFRALGGPALQAWESALADYLSLRRKTAAIASHDAFRAA
jgi:dTDP-4-dehydrorhamnose reductase